MLVGGLGLDAPQAAGFGVWNPGEETVTERSLACKWWFSVGMVKLPMGKDVER